MGTNQHGVKYANGYVGYPFIAPLDRNNCMIADGSGHLSLFSLTSKQVLARAYVGLEELSACQNLRSLCVESSGSKRVAAATRGGYAVIYDAERQEVQRIYPEQGGTVNSVAFSPEGQLFAIGTGFYPLSGHQQPAMIELWSLEGDAPECLGSAAMPGVCVDAMTWDAHGQEIAVATGLRSQDRGFAARIDASNLRPLAFIETPWAVSRRLLYLDLEDDSSHLAAACDGALHVLNRQDGSETWRIEMPEVLADFAYNPEENLVILTNGAVLDAWDGSINDRLVPMSDCTSIAIRPGGGYLGVSSKGRVCSWD